MKYILLKTNSSSIESLILEKNTGTFEYNQQSIINKMEFGDYLLVHNIRTLEDKGISTNKMFVIDTLRVTNYLFPQFSSKSLQYLRTSLELYKEEKSEARKYNIAPNDLITMKLLVSKFVTLIKQQFPNINPMSKLVELSKEAVVAKTFAFGKYKGKDIATVSKEDVGYIYWLFKNTQDMDLKTSIAMALEDA